jgi:hypothetical protein
MWSSENLPSKTGVNKDHHVRLRLLVNEEHARAKLVR